LTLFCPGITPAIRNLEALDVASLRLGSIVLSYNFVRSRASNAYTASFSDQTTDKRPYISRSVAKPNRFNDQDRRPTYRAIWKGVAVACNFQNYDLPIDANGT
jgi:hypothetical protein